MDRFGLIGKITAKPGQREALVQHLLRAAELVRSALGCDLYVVNASMTEPDAVWVVEAWRTEADHEASLSLPGVPELIEEAKPLIAEIADPIRTVPVGGVGLGIE